MGCGHKMKNRGSRLSYILAVGGFLLLLTSCAGGTAQRTSSSAVADGRMAVPAPGVCQDTKTGLMWQSDTSKAFNSLAEAEKYVASLTVGGHNDWRLPSVTELYGLYMTFDLHENGPCEMVVEGTYWSDEPDLEGRVGTWELDDNCDPERRYIPKQRGRVRAVRM
jgi:hypothetical protein